MKAPPKAYIYALVYLLRLNAVGATSRKDLVVGRTRSAAAGRWMKLNSYTVHRLLGIAVIVAIKEVARECTVARGALSPAIGAALRGDEYYALVVGLREGEDLARMERVFKACLRTRQGLQVNEEYGNMIQELETTFSRECGGFQNRDVGKP